MTPWEAGADPQCRESGGQVLSFDNCGVAAEHVIDPHEKRLQQGCRPAFPPRYSPFNHLRASSRLC